MVLSGTLLLNISGNQLLLRAGEYRNSSIFGGRDGKPESEMIVTRWQAPVLPTPEQVKMIFQAEGLLPLEEILRPSGIVKDHRYPFDEIRMVLSGTLLLNISGNQLLLRAGDRVHIPSNTRHSKSAGGQDECVCVVASRVF